MRQSLGRGLVGPLTGKGEEVGIIDHMISNHRPLKEDSLNSLTRFRPSSSISRHHHPCLIFIYRVLFYPHAQDPLKHLKNAHVRAGCFKVKGTRWNTSVERR